MRFLMEMFVLSYVNELCIYLRLWSFFKSFLLGLRMTRTQQTYMFYSYIVPLIYNCY